MNNNIYIFYKENGTVSTISYVKPKDSILAVNNYLIVKKEDLNFEERDGYYYNLKVDILTRKLYVEYFEIPVQPPTVEEEVKILKEENAQITYALMMEGIL